MKRFLLFWMVIALFAGQAWAATLSLTAGNALTLDDWWYSDPAGFNMAADPTTSTVAYGGPMQYQVGLYGLLDDTDADDGDKLAWVKWGTPDVVPQAVGFSRYALDAANDNQSIWDTRLFLTQGTSEYVSPWVSLAAGQSARLVLDFATEGVDASTAVDDIGLYIRGNLIGTGIPGDPYPSDGDAYHVSVAYVPVPTAIILGLLGVGVACVKLRKHA